MSSDGAMKCAVNLSRHLNYCYLYKKNLPKLTDVNSAGYMVEVLGNSKREGLHTLLN